MSWNDYEMCRRSLEMKTTARIFADRMREGDVKGMQEMAAAMKRTAEMAEARAKELQA